MVISFVALNVGLVVGICIVFARASMVRKIEDKLRMKLHFKDLPEEHMNTSQIIKYRGYPAEEHVVVTEDGYILSLQRIPRGSKGDPPNGEVVFMQHGLVSSSADWIMNSGQESLGFILADLGYDVWLGNSRGNTYSNRHVNLSTDDPKFWAFSWDEMAKYDLPATLNYIQKVTGKSELFYVGHSQGTAIAFAEFGRNPELAKRIKAFFALAPVTTVGHIKGAIKLLSYFAPELEELLKILGIKDFIPSDWIIKWLADTLCDFKITRFVCSDVIFLLAGPDTSNLNETRLPVYVSHTPAGTSTQDIIHWAQFRFVTPDAIFIESGCLLKNTKYINITDVKHAINNANGMHPSARDIKEEKTIGQSRGNGNMYSQSNYLTSQEQQKPVGSSQASKAINVPIQAPVAN